MQIQKIKYKRPKYEPYECLEKNKTYSVQLYLPIQIIYNNNIIYK